jgi:hypothetical protein
MGTLLPKPQRCYLGFGQPIDLSRYKDKKPTQKTVQSIRSRVAKEIETQMAELLIAREQLKEKDSLLRRFLTL